VKRYSMGIFGASTVALLAAAALGSGAAQAHSGQPTGADKTVTLTADGAQQNSPVLLIEAPQVAGLD